MALPSTFPVHPPSLPLKTSNGGTENHVCEVCTKSFRNSKALRRHRISQHIKKGDEHPCPIEGCSSSFKYKEKLTQHIASVHSEARPHKCTKCNKAFKLRHQLKRHNELIHERDRKYKCEEDGCGAQFSKKSSLEEHMLSHGTAPRLVCPHEGCGKAFSSSRQLTKHVYAAHSKTTHACQHCDFTSNSKAEFVKHITDMHAESLRCPKCHKQFKSSVRLSNHKCSVGQMFICNIDGCTKAYTCRRNLVFHQAHKHEGKSYACTFPGCDKKFSYKSSLELHVQKKHSAVQTSDGQASGEGVTDNHDGQPNGHSTIDSSAFSEESPSASRQIGQNEPGHVYMPADELHGGLQAQGTAMDFARTQ